MVVAEMRAAIGNAHIILPCKSYGRTLAIMHYFSEPTVVQSTIPDGLTGLSVHIPIDSQNQTILL